MSSLVRSYASWRPVWMIPMIYVGITIVVERHIADVQDQQMAMQEDRQGLGLSRKRSVKPMG